MANIPIEVILTARDNASATLKRLGADISDAGNKFGSLKQDLNQAAVAFTTVGAAITGLTALSIKNASQMEQQATAFRVLTGSAETGKKTLEDLINFAAKTPFQIPQILEQSKRLLAMGTTAENLIPTFKMLGDVAAGVGMEKLPQLVLAFGQIQAKGRLMGTELRQLTEAGFNLADALGISNQKLDEMVEGKEVSFEMVAQGFRNVTSEGGRFFNLMNEQAGTTAGKFSNLQDNIFKLTATIGAIFLPAVNRIIETITPVLVQFADWAAKNETLVTIIVAVGLTLLALGTAILVLTPIIVGLGSAIAIVGTIITTTIGIIGAIIAIMGGPLTLIILAIIAIGAALAFAWKNNWFGIRDTVQSVVGWFQGTAWPAINSVFNFIKSAVMSVASVWIDRFMAIKGAVEAVVGAIHAVISAAESMANRIRGGLKIPGFQTGGVVPGPVGAPQLAMVHGGEQIIPTGTRGGGSGGSSGGSLNMTVNIGMYAGTETEKRNIASELYQSLVRIARSQNLSVAQLLGG